MSLLQKHNAKLLMQHLFFSDFLKLFLRLNKGFFFIWCLWIKNNNVVLITLSRKKVVSLRLIF